MMCIRDNLCFDSFGFLPAEEYGEFNGSDWAMISGTHPRFAREPFYLWRTRYDWKPESAKKAQAAYWAWILEAKEALKNWILIYETNKSLI